MDDYKPLTPERITAAAKGADCTLLLKDYSFSMPAFARAIERAAIENYLAQKGQASLPEGLRSTIENAVEALREYAAMERRDADNSDSGNLAHALRQSAVDTENLADKLRVFAAAPTPPAPQDAQKGPAEQLESPAYGIIDPDYARVFTQARIIAWQYGYACVMHGSFTRDLDLLLVPWEEHAKANRVQLLKLIAEACGLRFGDGEEDVLKAKVDLSDKPHGRKACTLYFPQWGDRRWVDVSFMPTEDAQVEKDAELLDWLDEQNQRKNKQNGTTYGWKYSENHNRIALEDHGYPVRSVRQAIRLAMESEAERAAIAAAKGPA